MPRKPRLHVPGGIYHVILRGNNRQPVFLTPADHLDFEALVRNGLERYGVRVHAYCWMTNHVHLALQAGDLPLGGFMQWVAGQYARGLNRRQGRCGHVFEKRHRAILVQGDAYLLALIRYIHRNPVEAGLVTRAEEYGWSSHGRYLGKSPPDWLTVAPVLSLFSSRLDDARRRFDEFVHDGRDEGELDRLLEYGGEADQRLIGDDALFREGVDRPVSCPERPAQSLGDIVSSVCSAHGIAEAALESPGRNRRFARLRAEIALRAIEAGVATLSQVARRLNRSDAVICRSIQRYFGCKKHRQ